MKNLLDPIFTLIWLFLTIQLLLEKLLELVLDVHIRKKKESLDVALIKARCVYKRL